MTVGGTMWRSIVVVLVVAGAAVALESVQPAFGARPASSSTTTTVPGPSFGLIPAPPGLTTELRLAKRTVAAGAIVRATLIVKNATGEPIDLTTLSPSRCIPDFGVVITNSKIPFGVSGGGGTRAPQGCTSDPFMIQPGTNRVPCVIGTTYASCKMNEASTLYGVEMPACDPSSGRPRGLPAGKYTTVFGGIGGLALPAPAAQTLRIRT